MVVVMVVEASDEWLSVSLKDRKHLKRKHVMSISDIDVCGLKCLLRPVLSADRAKMTAYDNNNLAFMHNARERSLCTKRRPS